MTSLGITAGTVAALAMVAQVSTCSWFGQPVTIDWTVVAADATKVCSFAPDLPTVNQFIGALGTNSGVLTAEAVATAICNAYNAWQAANPPVAGAKQGVAPGTDVTFVTKYNGKTVTVHGTAK